MTFEDIRGLSGAGVIAFMRNKGFSLWTEAEHDLSNSYDFKCFSCGFVVAEVTVWVDRWTNKAVDLWHIEYTADSVG